MRVCPFGWPMSSSELLAKRVKRSAADLEDGNEPVWSVASSQYLQQKSKTGFVGLSNQGATCYLNSLIQTLYMTPELRSALYSWTYDPEFDGPEERCIPLHLQRLFLRLQLGSAAIVDTKDLTTSFGWTGNQAFQQHDVQELLRKLFEALDVCLTRGATAIRSKSKPHAATDSSASNGTHASSESRPPTSLADPFSHHSDQHNLGSLTAHIVNELYEGVLLDYIRCMECNFSRERKDPFFDVPISIREVDSLEDGLEKYLAPEVLSDGNQWNCEQCGTKVDAFKGLQFQRLPYFLSLQLNRFDYDYTTWRRIKLNNKVTFPQNLDMTQFFSNDDENESNRPSSSNPDQKRHQYELFSVMIHSGGAEGGHYFAFVKSFQSGKWYKFNDASVAEISDEDISSVFGGAPPKNTEAKAKPYSNLTAAEGGVPAPMPPALHHPLPTDIASATPSSSSSSSPGKLPLHSSYSTNAYMLIYRLVDPERNMKSVESDSIPETQLQWIQQENIMFDRLRAEHQKRLDNVSLTVFYDKSLGGVADEQVPGTKTSNPHPSATEDMLTFTVNVDKHETLDTALHMVYEAGLTRGLPLSSIRSIRLRPFTPQTGTKAPAWLESSGSSTLEQLNFHHQKNVYLELKASDEIAWEDEDVFYTLGVIKFAPSQAGFEHAVSLRVPWRSTLADLKRMITTHEMLSIHEPNDQLEVYYANMECEKSPDSSSSSSPSSSISDSGSDVVRLRVFVVDSSANCRELKGDEGVLNEIHQLSDGQCVHIEYLPPGPMKQSLIAAKFEEERHKVQIFYNLLDSSAFEHSILIDTRRPLRVLKDEIAKALGLHPSEFKMCRNLLSKEFNNLDLTLAAANLYEGSAVCLVRGRPLNVNEIKLKISIFKNSVDDEESFSTPWTVTIDESCTVEELRSMLATAPELEDFLVSSGKFNTREEATSSNKHIRLRSKKANRCATVLFDGDTLKTAMEDLMDGDEVVVQILDAPDTLARNQLILVFRRWVPLLRALEPHSFELIVPRNATMAEARQILAEYLLTHPSQSSSSASAATDGTTTITPASALKYAHDIPLQYLGVSKPYLFMIKKKDAGALSGLNWELADDVQLTQSPWYLGDGAILLFKDMRDPEHGNIEASSAGSGQPNKSAPREQGLTIHTIYDEKIPSQSETDASAHAATNTSSSSASQEKQ